MMSFSHKRSLKIILLIFTLLCSGTLFADTFPQKPIAAIIIVGNEKTKEKVITRELLFTTGDVATDSLIEESKNRLENLWLFNRVEFIPVPGDDESINLIISVTERLYIFPYPELRIEDRDWKKLTYGLGFAHDNFRGRNEKLYFLALFGNRPGFHFTYFNPWLFDDLHLTTGIYLKKYIKQNQSLEPIEPFDETHYYIGWTIGKYWTRDFYSLVTFSRDELHVNREAAQYLQSGRKQETNYGIILNTTYDKRDLYAYPSQGWYARLRLHYHGLFEDDIDYWKYLIDLRNYFSWNKLIFATRIFTYQSLGDLPVYHRTYFGYSERVRGYFFDVFEGKHAFLSTLALRFPIVPVRYFSLPFSVYQESATKNLKFGINGGLFVDTGMVWNRRYEFALNNFLTGFGGGIHFRLPYIEVLRFDLGFNEQLESQFIMEVEMAF